MSLAEDAIGAAETAAGVAAPELTIAAKVGALLFSNIWRLIAILALIAVGMQEARIDGLWLIKGWKPRALAAEQAVKDVKAAQVKASKDQIAVNNAYVSQPNAIAKESNHDAPTYYEAVNRAAAAHADGNRVDSLCAKAAQGGTSNPSVPTSGDAASVNDRSGITPGMVAVSVEDYFRLIGLAGRLAKVYQDAQALIATGQFQAASGEAASDAAPDSASTTATEPQDKKDGPHA